MTEQNTSDQTRAIENVPLESEEYRLLGNALINLFDIDQDNLTTRERDRLLTIERKIRELENIMESRLIEEWEVER